MCMHGLPLRARSRGYLPRRARSLIVLVPVALVPVALYLALEVPIATVPPAAILATQARCSRPVAARPVGRVLRATGPVAVTARGGRPPQPRSFASAAFYGSRQRPPSTRAASVANNPAATVRPSKAAAAVGTDARSRPTLKKWPTANGKWKGEESGR